MFNREASWRAYLQATINDDALRNDDAIIIKTDISSFYEHVYHHRLENCLADFFPLSQTTLSKQIDGLLKKFSAGRSFGLPVGGQCSRILAETMMFLIDQRLSEEGIAWHRYVDDFTLIASTHAEAYKSLSVLSHVLADYGLSLNRTKTSVLTAKHYKDYVELQIGATEDDAGYLREIDLHFDPYSDNPESDYEELRQTVDKLEIKTLLNAELKKSQPDNFLVAQIGRALVLQSPKAALNLCSTLLDTKNLHSFRGSWSTIMRGVGNVRKEERNSEVFEALDDLIDGIIQNSKHLLQPEANCLHFLRAIRFKKTEMRAAFVSQIFQNTQSQTIRRACIDCWRNWKDRTRFTQLVNQFSALGSEEKRMLWLFSKVCGDEGRYFRRQQKSSFSNAIAIGHEQEENTFASLYLDWAKNDI